MKPIDLLTTFLTSVRPPQGVAIEVIETEPHHEFKTNWEGYLEQKPVQIEVQTRFDSALKELKRQHPKLDWSGETEHREGKRRIARWLLEVESPDSGES